MSALSKRTMEVPCVFISIYVLFIVKDQGLTKKCFQNLAVIYWVILLSCIDFDCQYWHNRQPKLAEITFILSLLSICYDTKNSTIYLSTGSLYIRCGTVFSGSSSRLTWFISMVTLWHMTLTPIPSVYFKLLVKNKVHFIQI